MATTKKPSPAQLAARKRFAAAAKAGTLKAGAKLAKNPVKPPSKRTKVKPQSASSVKHKTGMYHITTADGKIAIASFVDYAEAQRFAKSYANRYKTSVGLLIA